MLGSFGRISASFVSRFDSVKVTETGEIRPKTVPDQIMVHGTLASGAAMAVHYRGGSSRDTNLLWEINGTEGDIQVTAASGHAQMAQLSIKGARGAPPGQHTRTLCRGDLQSASRAVGCFR